MTVTNRPTVQKKIVQSQFFFELSPDKIHRRQKGTVEVPHRSAELLHCRTQFVLGRIVPGSTPVASDTTTVQLTKTRQPRLGICLKGKKAMLYAQSRHTLTRCGMHFRSTQMGQCNGFRSRLWQLVRIFTTKFVRAQCLTIVL